MGFLTGLVGGDNTYLTFALALGLVLVLIVLAVWLIKLVSQAGRSVGRGRNRRLMVVDALPLDQKRQALLIRRDNVEHLIITGGPHDVIVETGIEAPPAATFTRPVRRMANSHDAQQAQALAEGTPGPRSRASAPPVQLPGRTSLRNTGLLRAVEPGESAPVGNGYNRTPSRADSATNGAGTMKGQAHDTAGTGDGDHDSDNFYPSSHRNEPAN